MTFRTPVPFVSELPGEGTYGVIAGGACGAGTRLRSRFRAATR